MLLNLEIGHCPFRFVPRLSKHGVEVVCGHPVRTTEHHIEVPAHLCIIRLDVVQERGGGFHIAPVELVALSVPFQRHSVRDELLVATPIRPAVDFLTQLSDEFAVGVFVNGFIAAKPVAAVQFDALFQRGNGDGVGREIFVYPVRQCPFGGVCNRSCNRPFLSVLGNVKFLISRL